MNNQKFILASAIGFALTAGTAFADQPKQVAEVVQIERVNVTTVGVGFRSSKIVGSSVTNDANDNIGKIDDVIVSRDGKTPFIILSVGGFLGVGSRLVAVPFSSLRLTTAGPVLPGGTKEELKSLPEFKYASN
jgi:hypothetical protein